MKKLAFLLLLLLMIPGCKPAQSPAAAPGTYSLENPTEQQKFERLLSVTLYENGAALLKTPPISSYALPPCTYSVADGELLIHTAGENGDVIARFTIADNALVFQSATVPLFADSGARYVHTDQTPYEALKWLDYFHDEKMPWEGSQELQLPQYPDTVFRWTPYEVKAIDSDGEKVLINGMPVWNVYLADLTGDGLPELCATISIGSGIIDTRVVVYDYAAGKAYELADRMQYDYVLSLKDGRLIVTQSEYNGPEIASGELAIVDGELTAIGIDRKPK